MAGGLVLVAAAAIKQNILPKNDTEHWVNQTKLKKNGKSGNEITTKRSTMSPKELLIVEEI